MKILKVSILPLTSLTLVRSQNGCSPVFEIPLSPPLELMSSDVSYRNYGNYRGNITSNYR